MHIFVDLDGVLVHQTGRDGFDTMPWMPDGKELWAYVKAFSPTLLSQLSPDIYDRGSAQKRVWCDRELGSSVPLIVVRAWYYDTAKYAYANSDSVLIDDHFNQHQSEWVKRGGVFIHHVSAENTIKELQALLGVDGYYQGEFA